MPDSDPIYFDNAATTLRKPDQVIEAVVEALRSAGGAQRGAHGSSLAASRVVYQARCALNGLFGGDDPARVCFAANATTALNQLIAGLVPDGASVVTTAASHNSVLRPLRLAADRRGVQVRVARIREDASLDREDYLHALEEGAQAVVLTHASNLTGDVYDIAELARLAHEAGALVIVDAAQTAGVVDIDLAALGIDALAFTGHKSLFGPQGTGGCCVRAGVEVTPLLVGGSGIQSYSEEQPAAFPEHLEAGTLNAHGIAGLRAGVEFVRELTPAAIRAHELELVRAFERGLDAIGGIRRYGGPAEGRTGVVAFNIGQADSAEVSDLLDAEFGIATRPGAHCAPLMHRSLGTERQGAVRASFSWFSTREEVDRALEAIEELAGEMR